MIGIFSSSSLTKFVTLCVKYVYNSSQNASVKPLEKQQLEWYRNVFLLFQNLF